MLFDDLTLNPYLVQLIELLLDLFGLSIATQINRQLGLNQFKGTSLSPTETLFACPAQRMIIFLNHLL